MKEKHELKLMDKIFEAYGKNWKEEEIEKKTNDIKDSVQICCQDPEMVILLLLMIQLTLVTSNTDISKYRLI